MRFALCQARVGRFVADDPMQSPQRTAGMAEEKLSIRARPPARRHTGINDTLSARPLWSSAGSALTLRPRAAVARPEDASPAP